MKGDSVHKDLHISSDERSIASDGMCLGGVIGAGGYGNRNEEVSCPDTQTCPTNLSATS